MSRTVGAGRRLLTYYDALTLANEFLIANGKEQPKAVVRRAVLDAYEEVLGANDWSFLEKPGRAQMNATQTSSTITYDHTGGSTCERELTIAAGSWPTWADKGGAVRISSRVYGVEHRCSSTVLQLDAQLNPGADVDAGTSYTLFQRYVELPNDFVDFTGLMDEDQWQFGRRTSMTEIIAKYRWQYQAGNTTECYAIGENPTKYGEKALWFYPTKSTEETADFVYTRSGRELRYTGMDSVDTAGSVTISDGATAVTGTSTTFESGMEGALLMLGDSSYPGGNYETNRYKELLAIQKYASADGAGALTLATAATNAYSTAKYRVTDPIDMPPYAVKAFLAQMELNLAHAMGFERDDRHASMRRLEARARQAVLDAMAADHPYRSDPAVTEHVGWYIAEGEVTDWEPSS